MTDDGASTMARSSLGTWMSAASSHALRRGRVPTAKRHSNLRGENVLPMCPDRSVTHVPGRSGEGSARGSALENRFADRAAGVTRAYRRETPPPAPAPKGRGNVGNVNWETCESLVRKRGPGHAMNSCPRFAFSRE